MDLKPRPHLTSPKGRKRVSIRRWLTLIFGGTLLFSGFEGFSQNTEVLKLETELKSARSDTQKLRLYTELNWLYLFENKIKAKEFAQKQINLASEKGFKKELAQGYNDMGLVANVESDFVAALAWHRKALAIRREIKDLYGQASSLSKIGVCHTELGQLDSALVVQYEALGIFEKLGNESAQSQTLGNLCALAERLKDYKRLEIFARQAFAISEKTKIKNDQLQALSYLAVLEELKGNVQGALDIYLKNADEYEALGDTLNWMACLGNVGFEYHLLKQEEKSRNAYERAYQLAEIIQDHADIVRLGTNLADQELQTGHPQKALALLERAESVGRAKGIREYFPQLFRVWGDYFIETGQKAKAKESFLKAAQFQDSLFNSDLGDKYSQLQTIYETDKREKEKSLLAKDNALKAGQLQLQRTGIWLGLGLILMIAIVLLMAYQRKILNQKRAEEVFRHKEQEQRAKAVLEAEERERGRIARELHDGVGQQLSVAKMNLSILVPVGEDQSLVLDNVKSLVEDATKELRSMSHTLLSNALLRSGLAGAVREFVQKIQGPIRVNLEITGLEQRLEQTTELVLFRVVQELMGNIIKHSAASDVYIQLFVEDGKLFLLLEDNGKGFDVSQQNDDAGVGLCNIRSRIDYLQGRFEINSQPGKGTSIVVEVPALFG